MAVSPKLRLRVFQRDGFTCLYCGAVAPKVELHVDHVAPKSKGGGDGLDNLATACVTCNLGKGDQAIAPPGWADYDKGMTIVERVVRVLTAAPVVQKIAPTKPFCRGCHNRITDDEEVRHCKYCSRPYHASDCIYEHLSDGGACGEQRYLDQAEQRERDDPRPICEDCGERFQIDAHSEMCNNCFYSWEENREIERQEAGARVCECGRYDCEVDRCRTQA